MAPSHHCNAPESKPWDPAMRKGQAQHGAGRTTTTHSAPAHQAEGHAALVGQAPLAGTSSVCFICTTQRERVVHRCSPGGSR